MKAYELNQIAAALPFPLQIMSVHNAAMDFIAVTNAIKQPNESFYLMGESYGAFLCSEIYKRAPLMFKGAILDGFSPSLHLRGEKEPDLRHQLSAVCAKSKECPSLIDPLKILTLVQDVTSTDNPCTEKIFERNSKMSRGRAVRRLILSIKNAYSSMSDQQATVAFLKGSLTCENPAQFDAALSRLRMLEEEYYKESATEASDKMVTKDSDNDNKKEVKKYTSKNAWLLMDLIHYSEKQMDVGTCAPDESQMLARCELFDDTYYPNFLKGHLYQPKPLPPFSTAMNQVIVIAAKGDHRTPHDAAEAEYRSMSVGSKSFYSFDYMHHVSLADYSCGREVMQQLMAEGASELKSAKKKAQACVDKVNESEFPWFEFDPNLTYLWGEAKRDQPVSGKPAEVPVRRPQPEGTPKSNITLTTIIVLAVGAQVVIALIVVVVLKIRKSRR